VSAPNWKGVLMLLDAARHHVTQLNWLCGASQQGLTEFLFWIWEMFLVLKMCGETKSKSNLPVINGKRLAQKRKREERMYHKTAC
jgi:hypothetical protein